MILCQVISSSEIFNKTIADRLPNCKQVSPENCLLLGAAIGTASIEPLLNQHAGVLRNMKDNLRSIFRQDALTLLRLSLGHPRSMYILRTGPCFFTDAGIDNLDAALREVCSDCFCLPFDGDSWARATLPPNSGGIGLRSARDTALPAFISSVIGSKTLADRICGNVPDFTFNVSSRSWLIVANADQPPEIARERVSTWLEPLLQKKGHRSKPH